VELHEGEKVLYEGHPSWRSTIAFYIKGLLVVGVIAVSVALVASTGAAIAVAVVGEAVTVLIGFIRRYFTKYMITSERLRIQRGIIARKVQQTEIARVQNVNTDQTVIQRILQVGTVDFDTAGTTDSDFKFIGVNDPADVVTAVDKAHNAPGSSLTP
jgi:uncharacterized membrane protein YdbT with pleckstrin-like domain